MPQFLSSVKLYLLVVLLPQLIYLLTNSHGLAAVCESCSPSNYIDLYLRLLRDPSSFSRSAPLAGTCTGNSPAETVSTNTDGASSVEHTEKTVSVKGHMVEEYQDKTAAALCSCLSRELSNLSTEETMAVQASSDDAQTVGGGWYVHVISSPRTLHMYNVQILMTSQHVSAIVPS